MNTKHKTAGRPRSPMPAADEIPDVALSHAAAQKLWGIPLSELARAKREGCPAFKGSRIYRDPLIDWLKANPLPQITGRGDSEEELKNRKLKAIVETLEHKLAIQRGEFVGKLEVQEEWARAISIIQDEAKGLMQTDIYPVFIARIKAKIKP